MRCREARALLEEGAGASVPAEGRDAVARHLADCADCREAAVALRLTSVWVELSRVSAPEPSPGFYPRLRAALEESQAQPAWAWLPFEFYGRSLAYALAGVALALAISVAIAEGPVPLEQAVRAEFDSPQPAAAPPMPATPGGHVDRDQVMLTLVSSPEARP